MTNADQALLGSRRSTPSTAPRPGRTPSIHAELNRLNIRTSSSWSASAGVHDAIRSSRSQCGTMRGRATGDRAISNVSRTEVPAHDRFQPHPTGLLKDRPLTVFLLVSGLLWHSGRCWPLGRRKGWDGLWFTAFVATAKLSPQERRVWRHSPTTIKRGSVIERLRDPIIPTALAVAALLLSVVIFLIGDNVLSRSRSSPTQGPAVSPTQGSVVSPTTESNQSPTTAPATPTTVPATSTAAAVQVQPPARPQRPNITSPSSQSTRPPTNAREPTATTPAPSVPTSPQSGPTTSPTPGLSTPPGA